MKEEEVEELETDEEAWPARDGSGTTIWTDDETKSRLVALAAKSGRTVVGQLRWLLDLAEGVQS